MGQKFNQASFDYNFFEERERRNLKYQLLQAPSIKSLHILTYMFKNKYMNKLNISPGS